MIEWVQDDIFNGKEQVLIHQVNCQRKFAKGLALEIRTRYQKAYEDYLSYVSQFADKPTRLLLGHVLVTPVEENKYIAHLFGQEYYGNKGLYTDYDAFERGLWSLKKRAILHGKSLSIPYGIGCGLAGGSWERIYSIIQKVFFDSPITIYQKEGKK